mgnify:CR=1 FL=1
MDPEQILQITADAFRIPKGLLFGGRRTVYRTQVRWTAAHLLRRTGQYSYADIARVLKYRDHTSARSAVLAIRKRMRENVYLRDKIKALEVQLHLPQEEGAPHDP